MEEHKLPNSEECKSLDEEENMFFFASSETPKSAYQLNEKQAMLCELFKTMIENEHAEKTTHANPVVLSVINHPDESFFGEEVHYAVNTNALLDYVAEYLNMWADNIKDSDYCTEDPVQSGDPTHYLKPIDIEFIENFISDWKGKVHKFDAHRYATDFNYARLTKIRTLSQLISQVDNFLGLESLAKKLYVYCATIVWNTSIVDIAEVEADPEFIKLQQDAITLWKLQNPEKAVHYVPSVTTGDGNENENILADLIEDDE